MWLEYGKMKKKYKSFFVSKFWVVWKESFNEIILNVLTQQTLCVAFLFLSSLKPFVLQTRTVLQAKIINEEWLCTIRA